MEDRKPRLILVNGPPAAGKSRLAAWLADELSLPLVAKDLIKEAMADSLGSSAATSSQELGAMAYGVLNAMIGCLLDAHVGLVVDCNFHKGKAEAGLEPLLKIARTVVIHCDAPREVLLRRYLDRAASGRRHPVHEAGADPERGARNLDHGIYAPLELPVPTLMVDTTMDYQPNRAAILDFARSAGAA